MSEETAHEENASGGLSIGDIYHVLFRRKWMIIAFAVFGVVAAAGLLAVKPPLYRTKATLLIKYVMEGKGVATPDAAALVERALNAQDDGIINTEAQIISSRDVARQVVDVVGAGRILAKTSGDTNTDAAVDQIQNNLEIKMDPSASGMITLIFQHPDPVVSQDVLTELIAAYMKRHKEIHQPELLIKFQKETERLSADLADTERQLKDVKQKAGVISVDDAKKEYLLRASRIREELDAARVELARHQTTLKELSTMAQAPVGKTNVEPAVPTEQLNEYRNVCDRVDLLRRRKNELLTQFTEGSILVRQVQEQLTKAEGDKRKLEEQYPRLTSVAAANSRTGEAAAAFDPTAESLQVLKVTSTMEVLSNQLAQVQADAAKLDEIEPTITELQRKKERQEAELKYASVSLEQIRREEAGAGKAPNIIPVNSTPTPPVKAWSEAFLKKVKMVAAGGLFAGIALAFFIEMFLDRSVKRRSDVEKKLRMPLFISIPDINRNGHRTLLHDAQKRRAQIPEAAEGTAVHEEAPNVPALPMQPWDPFHPLRRYFAGLRDRLITYFEVRNLNQKPKLVAVTSCGEGAGVSSVASGLAASLSETGDGNVLLVNMKTDQGASQQFYKGKPGCGLDDALAKETMESALVQSNLYVATEHSENLLPQLLPKRFANLMPELKASEYDYIIFDMPAISQTSSTPRLARLMDMVLLVIESEKTSQDVVKQATALLAESKATVSVVLNKTHNYVPKRLHQELDDI